MLMVFAFVAPMLTVAPNDNPSIVFAFNPSVDVLMAILFSKG
jgi:hypothetical protein